ncbi:MAG: multidrug transporter [Bacteroidota bacterium]|nr:multidrug transporter [Bacteroidota bacterium]
MAKSKSGGSKQPHSQPQSAITGKYVTETYANKHPKTTFTEKPKPRGKK